jgi:hypothetical protein
MKNMPTNCVLRTKNEFVYECLFVCEQKTCDRHDFLGCEMRRKGKYEKNSSKIECTYSQTSLQCHESCAYSNSKEGQMR